MVEQDFALPVLASLLWFFVFDSFTGVQVITMGATSADRFSYDGNPRWEVADRSVLNLLEQTPPFLLGLWLHALAASPTTAARLGWWWLMLRASYPVAFAYPSMSPSLWGVQRRLGTSRASNGRLPHL